MFTKFLSSIFLLLLNTYLFASTAWWNVDSDGNWNNNNNWTPTTFPNSTEAEAILGTIITAPRIITLGQNITLQYLTFNSDKTYSINGDSNKIIFNGKQFSQISRIKNNYFLTSTQRIYSDIDIQSSLNFESEWPNSSTLLIDGVISGDPSKYIYIISKDTIVFSGLLSNTFKGLIYLLDGKLQLNKSVGKQGIAGDIEIDGGILEIMKPDQIAHTSKIKMKSGTFDMGSNNVTISSLEYSGGSIIQTGNILSLTSEEDAINIMNNNNFTIGIGEIKLLSTSGGDITHQSKGKSIIQSNLDLGTVDRYFNIIHIYGSNEPIDMDIPNCISGSGGIIKRANGTLQFSGSDANTYTGKTTISEGTLLLNKNATAIKGDILINGGILKLAKTNQIAQTSNMELSSGSFDMSGNSASISSLNYLGGTLTQNGASLSLTGTHTALNMRNTTISNGSIKLTGASGGDILFDPANGGTATISSDLDLGGNGRIFNVPKGSSEIDMLLSGAITNGGIVKESTGTLKLSGVDKTYSLPTTVNAGTLTIDNCNINSDVVIGMFAKLNGTFTAKSIGAQPGSIISPGNSIGSITASDINLLPTSTYEVEIDQTSCDRLIATNSISIDHALLNVLPLSSALDPNFPYEIITSDTPVSGTFENDIFFANASITGTLSYNDGGNNVKLNLSRDDFILTIEDVAKSTSNISSLSNYLDSLDPVVGSDLDNTFNVLIVLPADDMADAMNQLHPGLYEGLALTQESNGFNISKIIQKRSDEFYQNCCVRNVCCKKKFSLWADPYGSFLIQDNHKQLIGFDSNSAGVILGFDWMIKRNLYLGIAGAYSFSDIDWKHSYGDGNINSYYGSLYSSYYYKCFFINASLLGAFNDFKAKRNVYFSTLDSSSIIERSAKSNHSGAEFLAHLNTGFIYKLSLFEIRPFISGDYLYLKEDAFKEKGADSLNLEVRKSEHNVYRAEVGLNFGDCSIYCRNKIMLDLKLSYIKEIRTKGKFLTSNLVNQPNSFDVKMLKPNRNIVSPGASVTTHFCCDRGTFAIRYDGEFSKKYRNNLVNLELGWQF